VEEKRRHCCCPINEYGISSQNFKNEPRKYENTLKTPEFVNFQELSLAVVKTRPEANNTPSAIDSSLISENFTIQMVM
jgi:hypothetical protein